TTASDCTFVSLLAARAEIIRKVKASSGYEEAEINARLICYCSDQAHSSVEKASLIGLVKLRFLPSDDSLSLRGDTLREAVDRDREEGLIPFYLCATLGTTGACAFDNLKELGPICKEEGIWMHVDAAYAGSAFICPEFRKYMAGVEHAQSFAFNPSKWLMVHFDCSGMWLKNSGALHRTFNVDPLYLKHENT
ncbi:histidine decarboxylase-like, partial [Littorina saxatilis]|uniref:histidine decarboxylase-like n=1 Tax=Littorina saxatilis TaxID=31220 RepID=UPI0038B4AC2F